MSAGEAHARLRLVDEGGNTVGGAFLELEEELWDPSGRRLTVLLDPGRIKRGLRANLESGAPLAEGRGYRLEVDAAWRDARGRPLGRGYTKRFRAGAADRTSPDVASWALAPPVPGTRAPLVLLFPEPLDRALLASALAVVDPQGRVAAELEDVAGNNLRRLFDVDLSRAAAARDGPPFSVRPFTIGSGRLNRSGS